jgi:hypothetical protein
MTYAASRHALVALVVFAAGATASAQSPAPATQTNGPGQTGILIGRQAGAPADHKDVAKDAIRGEAHKGTMLKAAPGRNAAGTPPTLPAPALRAKGAGSQEPAGGGQQPPGQGPNKYRVPGAQLAGQDPAGGGQQPPGQGPDKYRVPGARMAGQDRVQDGRGPGGPVQSRTGGAVRAHDGQSGSGMQNPLGVQVRQQDPGTAMPPGRAAGSAPTRGAGVPGQDLTGQPNPAAAEAAKAVR